MTPREDDPRLFRENVYKSWQVMSEIVNRISDECFIAHLGPNQGAGYDCLSLVTRNSEGCPRSHFLLNRNGVNALVSDDVFEDVWGRVTKDGAKKVADRIIKLAGLTRATGQIDSPSTRTCSQVLKWIEENQEEDFFVVPLTWLVGGEQLLEFKSATYSQEQWLIEDHGPEISMGIGGEELERFSQVEHFNQVVPNQTGDIVIGKRKLTPYAEESLGYYVYALRNPIDQKVFYVGKGVGSRVLAHANGVIDADDIPETMKVQTIQKIHSAGLQVESFIVQHGLESDNHAFQTESAVYGMLKLLDEQSEQNLFSLTNIIQPPTFEDYGLMSVDDVLSLYGEPADGMLIPHNSIFVKPAQLWRKGMPMEELWEYTRGWWTINETRIRNIRYVFSVPNFVIRAVWEVQQSDWREQGRGDRGWDNVLNQRSKGVGKNPRLGFDSCVDVSESKFSSLINKSVEHTYREGQGKRANVVYLDNAKVKSLASEQSPRTPFWNVDLR